MATVYLNCTEERGDFVIASPSGEYDLRDLVIVYYKADPQKIEYQFQAGYIVHGGEFYNMPADDASPTADAPTWRMILRTEFQTDPLGVNYALMSAQEKCDSLNFQNRKLPERFITMRTCLSDLGMAMTGSIYTKILAASAQNPVLAMGLEMMKSYAEGGGINICDDVAIQFIRSMRGTLLTEEEADAIESLAYTTRAKELIGRPVTVEEIEEACP